MKNLNRILVVLTSVALISCGEKKEEKETLTIGDNNQSEMSSTDANSSEQTSADQDVVEIAIAGNDQMQFDKKELRVKAGQTVRITLSHTGQMAKNVMGHNFVILTQGTDINEFGQKAATAADNEYIPENTDQVVAHTELIGGGESTTIEFTAPEAGSYDFICSFPGHYALMKGKFIVE